MKRDEPSQAKPYEGPQPGDQVGTWLDQHGRVHFVRFLGYGAVDGVESADCLCEPQLTNDERELLFVPLLANVRSQLSEASKGNSDLRWVLGWELLKELGVDVADARFGELLAYNFKRLDSEKPGGKRWLE